MKLTNLSIKAKLMIITMLTSSVALVLLSVSYLGYDLISFRHLLGEDLATQAEIIGYNSAAAMAFKDATSATAALSALKAKEDIVAAVLYSPSGKIFAQYTRPNVSHPDLPTDILQDNASRFRGKYLEVFRKVSLNGDPVGTLLLQSDMSQWSLRARSYATFLLLFMLGSVFLALLLASRLQNLISRPILRLEDTMRVVSTKKNYEVRALKFYDDEIGRLIDGFNTMLAEIQQGDSALQNANDQLQSRTHELEGEITHRKKAQEELLSAKRAAEDASRAKSAFLANMSHELRTPLNAIIGYSEMIQEEIQESGRIQNVQDVQKIESAGKHLLALINDVLDLSKIEAGKMALHVESFEPAAMVQELVATLQPAIAKNSNRIELQLSDDLGMMRSDITKTRQILANLLSNAAKFTDHGRISLNVDRTEADGQQCIRFRVRDTGIGISAEQQQNLFKEFAQADVSIARKYGGTGLGLAISHRFSQLMGGHMSVESEPGEGSLFTVVLPAQISAEDSAAPAAKVEKDQPFAAPKAKDPAETILVIDDDPVVRDLMSRFLGKMGFDVVAATSGEQGLALARRIRPAVITLDVVMPGIDGWGVLKSLKADPQLSGIPVIMVTIVDNEIASANLGASAHLVKPIDRDRLADLIERCRGPYASSNEEAVTAGVQRSQDKIKRTKRRDSQPFRSN
ncbi:MAG TPA: ATP-binding protein [Candidatus Acidoferrales bacterium]|nr:ATP-binding protein [Candidatus Acidoferrales bacterium]